jgi:hypothetical protein
MAPQPEPEHEEIEDELLPDIYTEIATGLIYECKFFDKFVIVRPASPAFYLAIRKFTLVEFSKFFEEYGGDVTEVRDAIRGGEIGFIVERK